MAPDIRTRANERARRRIAAADARHPLGEIDSREVRAIAVDAALDVVGEDVSARLGTADRALAAMRARYDVMDPSVRWWDGYRTALAMLAADAHLLTQGDESES